MNCGACGAEFDPSDLTQVMVHEHRGPVTVFNVEPGVCILLPLKPGENPDREKRLTRRVAELLERIEKARTVLDRARGESSKDYAYAVADALEILGGLDAP